MQQEITNSSSKSVIFLLVCAIKKNLLEILLYYKSLSLNLMTMRLDFLYIGLFGQAHL